MEFNEPLFVYSLTTRPVDAKRFSILFKPEWLSQAEYIPILNEIFKFTKAHNEPPSIETLKTVFEDKDQSAYELRYKTTLENLKTLVDTDRSEKGWADRL